MVVVIPILGAPIWVRETSLLLLNPSLRTSVKVDVIVNVALGRRVVKFRSPLDDRAVHLD